tara:strand:- start:739 stop:1176 length:438 start_codon:yes stop_codon:yes gene_type:complete
MSDTEITFTGTYTCTHHNDAERTACPVCLVTALTAERDQLRAAIAEMPTCRCDRSTEQQCELSAKVAALTAERDQLRAEVKRMTHAYEYDHKCLYEVRDRCHLWKQRAEKAEADLAKYLSACPASPTEEERKRCQQWWAISGKSQ